MEERKPSEIIEDFLNLISKSHAEYIEAKDRVTAFNAKTYEWTHQLEDAQNKAERNKLAYAWQQELKQRRVEKDRMKLWEKIHELGSDNQNKAFIKRIRHLLELQKSVEQYVDTPYAEREYKNGRAVSRDGDS